MAIDISTPGSASPDSGNPSGSSTTISDGPPLSPHAQKPARKHLLDMMKPQDPMQQLGASANDPFIQTMAGMKSIEDGVRQMGAVNPSLSPMLGQILQATQQLVVQSTMANAPGGPPSLMPPPPGIGPAPTPGIPQPSPMPPGV